MGKVSREAQSSQRFFVDFSVFSVPLSLNSASHFITNTLQGDYLITNAGLIVPTTTLKDRVWGKPVSDGGLADSINNLRKKGE